MKTTVDPSSQALKTRLVVGLGLAVLCYSMLQMMVVPTLPAMAADLNTTPSDAAWLVSGFLLCTAISTPLLGQLGDILGRSSVLVVVLALSAVGSILAMTAPTFGVLLVARILQGLGGATFPLAFGHARDLLPADRVPIAVGMITGGFGVGGSLGVVIAGPIADAASWRWIFSISLVMSLGAIACLWPTRRLDTRRERRLDWLGSMTVTLGLACILLAISQERAIGLLRGSLPLTVIGITILFGWSRRARYQIDPVFDIALLRSRAIWPAHVAAGLLGFAMYSNGYLIPLLVQHPAGLDADVTTSSFVLLPALLVGMASGYLGGRLGRSGATVPLIIGAVAMASGFGLTMIARNDVVLLVVAVTLAHGFGLNMVLTTVATLTTVGAPPGRVGEATGTNTAVRSIGGSIGSQVSAALVASTAWSPTTGFITAFGLCGGLMLCTTLIALATRRPS